MINLSRSREQQRAVTLNREADSLKKNILVVPFIVHIYLKQGHSLWTLSWLFDLIFSETIICYCRIETEIPAWDGGSSSPERPVCPFMSWTSALSS